MAPSAPNLPARGDSSTPPPPASTSRRLGGIAVLFARLGFIAFGGPAAHVALMEDEFVRRRRWLDRQHFLDLLAALNLVPGPTSTELAINLGLIRGGYRGMLVAGISFIVPAMLIILPIAWAYQTYHALPQVREILGGINAAVVAVVGAACWRFGKSAVRDTFSAGVFLAAVALELALRRLRFGEPELLVLAAAGIAGAVWYGRPRIPNVSAALLPVLAWARGENHAQWAGMFRLAMFFLKVGATLLGSGYVLISYLQSGLVDEYHWLTQRQLLDAVSVGQITPGPLLTTATFIGYLRGYALLKTFWGGVLGGVIATAAIFLPAFVFVPILGAVLPRVRHNPVVRGALDGMNAGVVALILVVAVQFGRAALWPVNTVNVPVALLTLYFMLRWNLNATWTILLGGLAGWARMRFGLP